MSHTPQVDRCENVRQNRKDDAEEMIKNKTIKTKERECKVQTS